jgi:hypothetical protein
VDAFDDWMTLWERAAEMGSEKWEMDELGYEL